mgnify:CR=1 FL=1
MGDLNMVPFVGSNVNSHVGTSKSQILGKLNTYVKPCHLDYA